VGGPRKGGIITYTHEYIEPFRGPDGNAPNLSRKESVSAKVSMVFKEPYIPLDKLEAGEVDGAVQFTMDVTKGAAARRLTGKGSAVSVSSKYVAA
jgi:hypothetical protein